MLSLNLRLFYHFDSKEQEHVVCICTEEERVCLSFSRAERLWVASLIHHSIPPPHTSLSITASHLLTLLSSSQHPTSSHSSLHHSIPPPHTPLSTTTSHLLTPLSITASHLLTPLSITASHLLTPLLKAESSKP